MSDNVSITAGSGTSIATDDVGGAHYQRVKLVNSTDGSSTATGTSADPLRVDPTGTTTQPVSDAGGSLTVDNGGTFAVQAAQSGTWNVGTVTTVTNVVHVDDNSSTISIDDGAGSITVDGTVAVSGTVTVGSHAVTNAGTFAVQVDGAALTALQLSDDIVYVDDADWTDDTSKHALVGGVYQSSPHTVTDGDVTPFLTDANGRLIVAATDNGGTLTVDGTVAVTHAALTELAAAIDTEVQCDIVGALPAGNNNIGDVDVASIVPGTGATNLGKAEDAAHTTGDVGVMALGVRQSSQSDFGADGDYVPFSVDDDGGLRVSIVAGAGSGGTAAADDADFSAGTTAGTPAMGVYESTPTSVTDGDLGTVGITSGRRLKTSATIDTALPAGTNAIGKLAANSGVDIGDVDITSIAAGDNNIGNVDIVSLPASTNTIEVVGDAAHDAAVAGNPLLLAAEAKNQDGAALPNAVNAEGDVVRLGASLEGVLYVMPVNEDGSAVANLGTVSTVSTVTTVSTVSALGTGTTGPMKAEDVAHSTGDMGIPAWGVRQDTPNATAAASGDYHYLATDLVGGIRTALYETDFAVLGTNHVKKYYTNAGAVTDGIVWSPAAGKRWYVTDIVVNVSAACTVTFEDDKAGGDEAIAKFEFAANSGWSQSFNTPWFSGEDAADLLVTTTAGNIYITITGYEI